MKNWEKILISPQTSLEKAISILDKGAKRILVIVDETMHLLGTITDGDIRRALIKQTPMNCPINEVMCSNPHKGEITWSKTRILATMEQYQLLQLPLVDDAGRVVGVETLHDVLKDQHLENPVFLIAGGFGTRLYPLTETCPKPLLKIGKKPILEHILERFIEAGFHQFFISTHFMPHLIESHFGNGERFGVHIEYVYEPYPLGTGGALSLLPLSKITLPVIMMNADLLTLLNFKSLLEFHEKHQAVATVSVREYEHQVPFGVMSFEGHKVNAIVEKPRHRSFINAGIYVLSPEFIKNVPQNTKIDMPELLQQHIAMGHTINMFPIHEYWRDIGRLDDFHLAQEEVAALLEDEK